MFDNKKRILMFTLPILLVVALLGYAGYKSGIVGNAGNTSKSNSSKTQNADSNNAAAAKSTVVTYDNYLKIKIGMTYDDVKGILGEGQKKELKSGVIDYTWKSQKDSIFVQTNQGKVVTKIQKGLGKTTSKQLTVDQLNQIKSGMTFDQVVAIMGPDYQEISYRKSDNSIMRNVEWLLPDSTNIKIYMQDEKVIHKSDTLKKKKAS